jgi:predicted amidohydrolase YtcJ
LCDAHIHLTAFGLSLASLRLDDCESLAEGLALLVAWPGRSSVGKGWLVGGGYDLNRWRAADPGFSPTSAQLDAVVPDQPVVLGGRDGHSAWVNSRALALAGIGASTPDPAGGSIVRDPGGNPTGLLLETAIELVRRHIPATDFAAAVAATARAAQHLASRGVRAVHTMAYEPPEFLRAAWELEARGELPLRIWACLPHTSLEAAAQAGLRGGVGDRVRLGGIKFFADGALGSRTAWMLAPFVGDDDNTGISVDAPETMVERGRQAIELGFSPVVHAIGDRANREVLDVLAQLAPLARARGVPLRLEHAQHLDPAELPRFAALGVVASLQPVHIPFDAAAIEQLLGPTRAAHSYACRSLLDAGATLALGSDAPVATPDPVAGIRAAVLRHDNHGQPWQPQQALSWHEALCGYTSGPAHAAGWQRWYGHIRPGAAAEFTSWDANPSVGPATPWAVEV